MSRELNENYSDRGFMHLDPVKTSYGANVRIYESSAASGPHIWLAINQPPPEFKGQLEEAEAHAHMSLEEAEEIHARLGHMITFVKESWGRE